MDPITLIVTALAAGAALGVKDAASSAVQDAYGALKSLVKRKLTGRRDGGLVLDRHEQSPDTWKAPLEAELEAAGAGDDAELLAAAQKLMSLADEAGSRLGKYNVVVHGSHSFQIGDHNVQHNVSTAAPSPETGPQ